MTIDEALDILDKHVQRLARHEAAGLGINDEAKQARDALATLRAALDDRDEKIARLRQHLSVIATGMEEQARLYANASREICDALSQPTGDETP